MSEIVTITPTWRSAEQFEIYRNPDSRDRREMIRNGVTSFRFILTGRADLYVGDAYTFTHYDSHSGATEVYGSTEFWSGELVTAQNPALTNPNYKFYHHDTFGHTTFETNTAKTAILIRTSNFHLRERGLLEQSISWGRFTSGISPFEPRIEPLKCVPSNVPISASTRAFVMLHGDGNLYVFPHDVDHLEAERILRDEEIKLVERYDGSRGTQAVIGMRLGGNGNLHFVYSEVTHPREFLLDNRNFRNCFGLDLDYDFTEDSIRMKKVKHGNQS